MLRSVWKISHLLLPHQLARYRVRAQARRTKIYYIYLLKFFRNFGSSGLQKVAEVEVMSDCYTMLWNPEILWIQQKKWRKTVKIWIYSAKNTSGTLEIHGSRRFPKWKTCVCGVECWGALRNCRSSKKKEENPSKTGKMALFIVQDLWKFHWIPKFQSRKSWSNMLKTCTRLWRC